jgi:hypothetical protein
MLGEAIDTVSGSNALGCFVGETFIGTSEGLMIESIIESTFHYKVSFLN